MARELDAEALRLLATFESVTGVEAIDCVVDDARDRVAFVVPAGDIAAAIGPDGRTVEALEGRLGRDVHLVELAERAEDFVANCLRPAAVYGVTIEDGRAIVEVADADRGTAIGAGGGRIELARTLAARHFDLETVELA
ncbi:MAG: NusA-like transcription termination signal-binding factor [Halobacteriales archaeon]